MEQVHDTIVASSRTRRAQRFPIRIAMRYRPSAESKWHEGTTENISSSGVLFRTEHIAQPDTPVEIKLILPGGASKEGSPEVICRGVIVRVAARPDSVRALALGTKFFNYRFFRR